MKQNLLNNPNTAAQAGQMSAAANAFIAKGPSKGSFANEMTKLQNANEFIKNSGEEVLNQGQVNQELLSPEAEVAKFKTVLSQALKNKGIDFDKLSPEMKEKLAQMQDIVKQESIKRQSAEEGARYAQEADAKFGTNETNMANVGQANQKQITDAAREGNVGEQQQQAQDNGEQRKEQLANWEDLAPRVIEDTKNRAVRIDIPGLPEVETVIVRMQGNTVSIQAVGDGKVMEKLQRREKELVSKLGQHDILVESVKTFDSSRLNKGKAG